MAKAKTLEPQVKETSSKPNPMFFIEKSETSRVYFQVKEYKGKSRLDIREHFYSETPEGKTDGFPKEGKGVWIPTSRGTAISAELMDEVLDGLKKLAG